VDDRRDETAALAPITSDHDAAAVREGAVDSILDCGRLDTVPGDLQLVVDAPYEIPCRSSNAPRTNPES
jgi:hypothetical protein